MQRHRTLPHLSIYVPVSVNVIQVKRPLQLFPQSPPQQCGQPHHKVLAATGNKGQRTRMGSDSETIIAQGSKEVILKKNYVFFTLNLMEPLFVVSNALKR